MHSEISTEFEIKMLAEVVLLGVAILTETILMY